MLRVLYVNYKNKKRNIGGSKYDKYRWTNKNNYERCRWNNWTWYIKGEIEKI